MCCYFLGRQCCEKRYLQFSIPTGSGEGGERGVSHRLKVMCHTDALLWSARQIASMALPVARERHAKNVWHIALRQCETPPSPPYPDPVGIENCKQLFSQLLAFTTQKIARHSTDISARAVAFFRS